MSKKWIWIAAAALFVVAAAGIWLLSKGPGAEEEAQAAAQPEPTLVFGCIEDDCYHVEEGHIANGENLSVLLGRNGVSPQRIDRLSRMGTEIFDPRMIRAGQEYHMFYSRDSLAALQWMVYQKNRIDYVVFDLRADSIAVSRFQKEITTKRQRHSGRIESSLWNCMIDGGMTPALAMDLSDIYAWSIDFFGLQKGDEFTVVYDEHFVDSLSVGCDRIWGAIFKHSGKEYYAIPFKQGAKITYWDENGNSLRKNLLKAPLKYSRISSRFSNGRMHPILKIRRPHHAVDYAAPSGTPVVSVADGTVIQCGYSGGGGNTVKIKHAGGLQSGYLHLKGYAKGIRVGAHVSQGDLIGYVGSTGLSTGPHLDFRLTRNGQPIDPLKVPTEPTEPISAGNREAFAAVKERIIAEVLGTLPDSLRITQLDSLTFLAPKPDVTAAVH